MQNIIKEHKQISILKEMQTQKFNNNAYLSTIKDYVSKELMKGRHPSYRELDKRFNLAYNKLTLKNIYPFLGIPFLYVKCRRPNSSLKLLKGDLINYLKNEVKKDHFPSRRELENKFRLRLNDVTGRGIKELYKEADITYKQNINQETKSKKAQIFKEIIIKIIPKLNLKLILERGTHERGIDLIVVDDMGKRIGIELKAYNRFEAVKKKNVKQLNRFIRKEKLEMVYLFTTTNKIQNRLPLHGRIKIFIFEDLKRFCNKNQQAMLKWIRTHSVNYTPSYKRIKREEICNYVRNEYNCGRKIGHREIARALKLSAFSYFKSICEIYKAADLPIPLRKIRDTTSTIYAEEKIRFLNQVILYLKSEIQIGHYPSGEDINKKFKVNIWNKISMTALHQKIGEKPYSERRKIKP
ncbi:restriction endonuclease [Candidatus Woesearchaeota archaeon]|nr:restriction endonuclease [Candidatus Woesearchaeota archaeon]